MLWDSIHLKIDCSSPDKKDYICREMIQIERHIKSIAALCRKYKVNRLFVFGSVLTDRFNDGSDIDMVVDFKKDMVFLAQALGGSVKHFP